MRNRRRRLATVGLCAALLTAALTAQTRPDILWMRGGNSTYQGNLNAYYIDLALSPNGLYYAAVHNTGMVKIWRVHDGRLIRTIFTSQATPRVVAFSPDSQRVAIGDAYSGYIRIVRICDGVLERTLQGHTNSIMALAYSPDGAYLASAGYDGKILVWRMSDSTIMYQRNYYSSAVAFSPDGQTLVCGIHDGRVLLFRASDGTLLRTLAGHTQGVYTVAFSPNGQYLASGGLDNTLRLWRLSDGAPVYTLSGFTCVRVAFSPDSAFLASASSDSRIRVWSVSSGALVYTIEPPDQVGLILIAYTTDGQYLVSTGQYLHFWRASDGEHVRDGGAYDDAVYAVAFSPDEQFLATGSEDGSVKIWRVRDGALEHAFIPNGRFLYVFAVAYSPNGEYLAVGGASQDAQVRVYRTSDWQQVAALVATTGQTRSLAFSPDGQYLARGGYSTIYIWRVSDWTLERTLVHGGGGGFEIHSLAFSPDGNSLASASRDGTVSVWDWRNGTTLYTTSQHNVPYPYTVAFSPDGQYLLEGGITRIARLRNASTGALVREYISTDDPLYVAFTSDGQHLIHAGHRGVFFWNINNNTAPAQTYTDEAFSVRCLAVSPSGKWFAYGRLDAVVVLARNPFASLPEGDVNADGCVDDADLLAVLFAFGEIGMGIPEDLNKDCMVDDADLLLVLFNFGTGC